MSTNLRQLFDRFDKDKSGTIEVRELDKLLAALKGGVQRDEETWLTALAKLRPKNPAKITFVELEAWWSAHGDAAQKTAASPARAKNAEAAFDRFDTDRSGSLDARELEKVLVALGMKPSSSEIETALAKLDTDGDGRISRAEFAAWWSLTSI